MKIRVSSSVFHFKERAENTWKLKPWEGINDPDKELLFFGVYHDRDWEVFDNFDGKKIVFWCGSDILRLMEDYERKRIIKNNPCDHYCENEIEAQNLRTVGIEPIVIPSFLDDINKYPITFEPPRDGKWKVWLCGHPEREEEYGFVLSKRMAKFFPDIEFHFYGVEKPEQEQLPNIIYHGKVPEDVLNEEINNYHCGFRPNFHDGVSEVMIKSMLLGQYPITRIKYEGVWNYENEKDLIGLFKKLKEQVKPYYEGRSIWLKRLNQFPWCKSNFINPKDYPELEKENGSIWKKRVIKDYKQR
jgi:hypothetical protein